jgi:hypothetical protein
VIQHESEYVFPGPRQIGTGIPGGVTYGYIDHVRAVIDQDLLEAVGEVVKGRDRYKVLLQQEGACSRKVPPSSLIGCSSATS